MLKFATRLLTSLVWFAVICGFTSLAGLLSRYHLAAELLSHFRIQYIAGLLLAILAAGWLRRPLAFVLLLIPLLIHTFSVAQTQWPRPHSAHQTDAGTAPLTSELRLLSSNLLASNERHEAYIDLVEQIDPDIILLQEFSARWESELTAALRDYPHFTGESRHGSFGIGIYSKYPIEDAGIIFAGERAADGQVVDDVGNDIGDKAVRDKRRIFPTARITLRTRADDPKTAITLLAVHPPPPISGYMHQVRNQQLKGLASIVNDIKGPVVIAGDFNISPWSAAYTDFMRDTGAVSARRGLRVKPTWPAYFPLLYVPIDHILAAGTNASEFGELHSVKVPGSDHLSLWVDIHY